MVKGKMINRILVYTVSLLIMAFGVVLSVNSGLGVSPGNCLPYVINEITGLRLGFCVITLFTFYVLLQILILCSEFRLINLLQIACALLFGYFTDFAKLVVGEFSLHTYVGKLMMLAASIFLIAFGISLYLSIRLVPMPAEGLMMALTKKAKKTGFPHMKIFVDCAFVFLSIALSLIFLHELSGVREGTALTALLVGRVIGWIQAPVDKFLKPLCFEKSKKTHR